MSANPPEIPKRCPMPIIRREWAEDGSDTYTDVVEQCDGDLYVEHTGFKGHFADHSYDESWTWLVKCTEGGHVILTPYDDTNGPTVPSSEVDEQMIARAVGYITSISRREEN